MEEKKSPKTIRSALNETELAKVGDLLKAVGLALNNISLYTAKHRIAFMSLEQAYQLTDNHLSLNKELNLSLVGDQLLVENTPMPFKNPLIGNLLNQIKKWKIDSVTLKAGLTQDELLAFLESLILKPDKVDAADLQILLGQKKVSHIALNKAVFIKASEAAKGAAGKEKKSPKEAKEIVIDEEKLSHFLVGLVKAGAKVKNSVMSKLEKEPDSLARDIMESLKVKYDQLPETDPDTLADEIAGSMDRIGEVLEKEAYAGKGKTREQLAGMFKALEEAVVKQIDANESLAKKKDKVFSQANLRLCKIKVGIIASEFEKRKKSFEEIVELTKSLLTNEEENKRILPLLKSRLTLEGMSEASFRDMLEKAGLKPKEKEDRRRDIEQSISEMVQEMVKTAGIPPEKVEVQKKFLDGIQQLMERQVALETHELKVENELVHQRVDKMDSIFKSVADAIVVVNPTGEVVYVNPAGEHLLGTQKEKIVGKHILSQVGENQMITMSKDSLGEKGTFEPTEIEVRGLRDTVKTLRQSVGVIHNKDGQAIGTVAVLSDITKQKEIDKLKTEFVSNVSHELRTPLVSIQKSIELILEKDTGQINSDQERFLQICSRNVTRLMRLINDILDMSKIEAGKLRLNVQSVDVTKLVRETSASMFGWAQSKEIALELKFEEPLPHALWDYDKVIQVLTNFISNAIKYTPEKGMVEISVKSVRGDEGLKVCEGRPIPMEYPANLPREPLDEYVVMSVRDNGTGIASENLEKIFDKFFQIQHTSGGKIAGTGLGLPIARQIVQLHHGKIWVASKIKQGTAFTVALPVRDNSLIFA